MREIDPTAVSPTADMNSSFYSGVFDASVNGRYYSMVSPGGNIVGVVWTDENRGFGFIPSDSTVSVDVTSARHDFKTLAQVTGEQKLSASDAYDTSKRFKGYTALSEMSGPLSDALDRYETLNDSVDFTADASAAPGHDIVEGTETADPASGSDVEPTSTGTDLPNGATFPLDDGNFLSATVDDSGQIVDLTYTDETGYYTRSAEAVWEPVADEDTEALLDDKALIDVTPEFIAAYDTARGDDEIVSEADLEQYRADAS